MTDQNLADRLTAAQGVDIDAASAAAAAGLAASLGDAVRAIATSNLAFEDEPSHFLALLSNEAGR